MTHSNSIKAINRISLDELASRLHDILNSQPEVPSPDHLRSLLVQALGQPDWEDSMEAWEDMECSPENKQQSAAVVDALWEYQSRSAVLQEALEWARTDDREPQYIVDAAKGLLHRVIAPLERHKTSWLISRIRDEAAKALETKTELDSNTLDKLDRLLERAREDLDPIFYPTASHSRRPIPDDILQKSATLIGDWRLLARTMDQFENAALDHDKNYENYEAVQSLCKWWNENAPQESRHAGCFYIHELNEDGVSLSILGYEECPSSHIEDFSNAGDFALFEIPGRQPLAITFLRGKQFNRYVGHLTQVYAASGELYWEIGAELENIDEAVYSVFGLKRLSQENEQFRKLMAIHQAEEIDNQTSTVESHENTVPIRL